MIHLVSIAFAIAVPCSAADYGATGDGITDDRLALQAAIYACADLVIPPGRYLISRAAWQPFDLHVPSGHRVTGAGRGVTTMVQAPGQGPSVRLLHVDGADVTITDLALDGDRAHQTPDEHRAGIFAMHAPRLALRRVDARNFTGDGFYVYDGSDDFTIDDVEATGNGRNGITLGGLTSGGSIYGSRFVGNGAQQIDSEPGRGWTVDGVLITGCTIDGAGVSGDYVLTMSGSGAASRSRGWTVIGNVIIGATLAVWLDGSLIAGNTGVNPTAKPCYVVNRRSVGVTIAGNTCTMPPRAGPVAAIVEISGTSAANMPEVALLGNELASATATYGVRVHGAAVVYLDGNTLAGPGVATAGGAGVYLRTTVIGAPMRIAVVSRNAIVGWPAAAMRVAGNAALDGTATELELLEVTGNVLDSGLVIERGVVPKRLRRSGNRCTATCPGLE